MVHSTKLLVRAKNIFPKYFEQCIGLNFHNVWTLTSDLFYDLAISVQPMAHLRYDINHCQNAFHHERRKTTESSVRSTWQNSVRLDIALRLCNGQQCVTQCRNFSRTKSLSSVSNKCFRKWNERNAVRGRFRSFPSDGNDGHVTSVARWPGTH